MSDDTYNLALRMPKALIDRLDALVDTVRDSLDMKALVLQPKVTRSTVARLALLRGVEMLEGGKGAVPAAPKPKAARTAPAAPKPAPKAAPARAKRSSREKPAGSMGGQRLRAWRDGQGLTQGGAADRFEAKQLQVSRWETAPWDGNKGKPTAKWRDVLARETGIDPDAWGQPAPNPDASGEG